MMAKIAVVTLVSLKFIYRCQNSALLDWGLWALQIFLNCSLSWSKDAQKENLIYSQHWFLISTQRKRKICQNYPTISLQPQNRSSLGHFAKELPWPHSLEKIRECSSVLPEQRSPAAPSSRPDSLMSCGWQGWKWWKVLIAASLEGITTLTWGLEKLDVSDNQRLGF